ncbi:MAG: DNA damage-inducible protein D [Calditrichaeota bacterium]|nr:MAG: DNA damage-inducible protein D [Calditrichota bacterium]
MKKEIIQKLHTRFEDFAHSAEDGVEFWFARDLQQLLGYSKWQNFSTVILKAINACIKSGQEKSDHFTGVSKMVDIGSNTKREIDDIILTRYACYLIAQNGDPNKVEIAFAQTYFAVQTRKQEIIEKRIAEIERLEARKKLTNSEKELSQVIFERVKDERSFARIRSKGDSALFGGKSTSQMKQKLKIPKNRPLADFLPTITIKAKDFANEITNFNINKENLISETGISAEHVKNNEDVRKLLTDRNITPEELPPAEDAQKVARRLKSDEKKIAKEKSKKKK